VNDQPVTLSNADVVDRLARLRVVLPLMASDLAAARRRSVALEIENRRLARRVSELEARLTAAQGAGADASLRRRSRRAALPRQP
jgi:hypothetical protein